MKTRNNTIQFSASDVSSHIGCQYLTQLKLRVASKELTWPVFNSVSEAVPEGLATSKGLVIKFSAKFAQLVTDLTSKGQT